MATQTDKEKAIELAKDLKALLDTNLPFDEIKDILLEGRCSKCWSPMYGYTCWNCYESPPYDE